MPYFFVLGTNSALSLAELNAVLKLKDPLLLAPDFLVSETIGELDLETLIKRLGGTIKIGRVITELPLSQIANIGDEVNKIAKIKQSTSAAGKFNFGFSDYGAPIFNKKDLGLKLKKYFSLAAVSSRFVVSRERNLSSVIVAQNKLLTKGIEIVLASSSQKIYIGETIAVQAFKDLSLRDYGRPARDDLSGMLPPKLAQIMINLAQVPSSNSLILDPFCGSGTILSEAMLLGYQNLFAADISLKAVEDTRRNFNWTKEMYKIVDSKLKLFTKNVLSLSKFIKAGSVEAIITEPYLGPQRNLQNIPLVIRDLEELYSQAISQFKEVLRSSGRIVMIWPLFYGQRPITPDYSGFKIVNMLPDDFKDSKFLKKNNRATIIYGRPGQRVFREVVVLEKI
ncbi:MAG: hypothetical protein WC863_03410 [Patescibacteria group bacterium]